MKLEMLARFLLRFAIVRRLVEVEQLRRDMGSQRQIAGQLKLTQGGVFEKWQTRHNQNADRFNSLRFFWMSKVKHI